MVLGLVGGGGSILAVPLLIYLVGVRSPHAAIGTAAVAVAINALAGLLGHARANNVKWPCALVFAASGAAGAALGAVGGRATDGQRLLTLFGVLMIGVGAAMARRRQGEGEPLVHLDRDSAARLLPRLIPVGFAVGLLAGFFGIGGGFLIVPGLMLATAMPLRVAIGTSLVAVTALGATTAISYALAGQVDWWLVAELIAGGALGSIFGVAIGKRMSGHRRVMELGFAAIVVAVGLYVTRRGLP